MLSPLTSYHRINHFALLDDAEHIVSEVEEQSCRKLMSAKSKSVGEFIGTALISYVATNADDLVVLMNFFTESTVANSSLKVRHIFIGQYLGFIVLLGISLVGYGLSFAVPIQMLGFLGFLPIALGLKGLIEVLREECRRPTIDLHDVVACDEISTVELEAIRYRNDATGEILFQIPERRESITVAPSPDPSSPRSKMKQQLVKCFSNCLNLQILKIMSITLANSADNVAVYSALFAQASSWQIAVYIIIFLAMVLVWLLFSYFFINFRPILSIAQRYAHYIVPLVFIGIGIYIIVSSECFPWLATAIRTGSFKDG